MRVTIIDLDWYNHTSFLPNPLCMKLSSYYKQQGYNVNFPLKNYELTLEYDIMYIVREKISGKLPKELNICDPKVNLVGQGFRFYSRHLKQIDNVIMACRPDYNLYPLMEKNRANYNSYVNFFGSDGRLLPVIQDFHSAYEKAKDVIVTDVGFWNKKIEDIEYCLELLKNEENVVFSDPISLKKLVNDAARTKLFLNMKLKRGYPFEFISDFDKEDNLKVMEFLRTMREKYSYHYIKLVEFKVYDPNKEDIDNIEYAFQLAKMAKEMEVHILLKAPNRMECALWAYYEDLEAWSRNGFTKSYVDYLMEMQCRVRKIDKGIVTNNEIYWSLPPLQNFADICRKRYDIIKKYGFICWGDLATDYIPFEKILRLKENK